MTREELIELLSGDILPKAIAGVNAYSNLRSLAQRLLDGIADTNIVAQVLDEEDINQIRDIYAPQYIQLLTEIELVGDSLGTDGLK